MNFNKFLCFINVFLLQAYLVRFYIGPYPSNLQEVLIGIQLVVFVVTMVRQGRFWTAVSHIPRHVILMCFGILLLSSALVNPIFDSLTFIRHLKFFVFAALLVFLALESFQTESERHALVRVMGFGALAFGLFSALYNVLGYHVAHDYRLLGPMDSAVYLGYYLTPFFLFFTFNALEKRSRKDSIWALMFLLLLVMTRSMGSLAGSFIIIVCYMARRSDLKILKKKSVKITLGVFALAIMAAVFSMKILPTLQTEWSSLDERFEIWATSLELLKDPRNFILGLGYGQFQYHFIETVDGVLGRPPLNYIILQPHNFLFLFWFQFGFAGLLLLLFVLIRTINSVLRERSSSLTWALILFYFFIHGLIDTPWFKNDTLFLLLFFMELQFLTFDPKPVYKKGPLSKLTV